jgi:membrane-associated phospholipid phosphatase
MIRRRHVDCSESVVTVHFPDSPHPWRAGIAVAWKRICTSIVPPDNEQEPSFINRLLFLPLIYVPWLVLYEWVVYLGRPGHAFETYLPGEIHWPIWQWTELLYVSPYLLVTLAPFFVPTNRGLRRFIFAAVIATVVAVLSFLTIPAISTPRPFHPGGFLGRMMLTDRWLDRNNGAASFPSFHVVWSFLGASVFVQCRPPFCAAKEWTFTAYRAGCWLWATLVSASCVLTGMHSIVDVIGGFVLFALIHQFVWRDQVTPASGV